MFPDGVVLGDVVDAIAAAGIIGNYLLAHQLSVQYALDVCVRCARQFIDHPTNGVRYDAAPRTALSDLGIMSSWGSVCPLCKLTLLATGITQKL